jgi:hypothetical protein
MHYRTPKIGFLEPADAFLERFGDDVHSAETSTVDSTDLPTGGGPVAVVPGVP